MPTPDVAAIKVAKKTAPRKNPVGALQKIAAAKEAAAKQPKNVLPKPKAKAAPKPKVKSLPAKEAAKHAAPPPKKTAPAKVVAAPKQLEVDADDEDMDAFLAAKDEELKSMAKQLVALEAQCLKLSGGDEYAAKGEPPTEYEQAEAHAEAVEGKISAALGGPRHVLWDVTDDGELAWDESVLDNPLMFNDDGDSLLDDDGESLLLEQLA